MRKPTDPSAVVYPDSGGRPMADNTLQYQWIVTLQGGLDALFAADPTVFVAGDHLIYPVYGNAKIRNAPDVYVAFGRPKGHRGSYKVWEEGGVFPQVVIEVMSPGNRPGKMAKKRAFYAKYGAEEYLIYDPDRVALKVYRRTANGSLRAAPTTARYVSPRLGVTFDLTGPDLVVLRPDGQRFLTFVETVQAADEVARVAAEAERAAAEAASNARREATGRRRAEIERDRAVAETERLRAALRAAGLDPDAIP